MAGSDKCDCKEILGLAIFVVGAVCAEWEAGVDKQPECSHSRDLPWLDRR